MNNELLISRAREDQSLRAMSPRVERLYAALNVRMNRAQKRWGAGDTIVNATTRTLSIPERRVLAMRHVLEHMPIDIEPDDMIAGLSAVNGTIYNCKLPTYTLESDPHVQPRLSHKTPDYFLLLRIGLSGVIDSINQRIEQCPPYDIAARECLTAMLGEINAVIDFAHRYAALARSMAHNSDRHDALTKIADILDRVPEHPARTLREAVQSFWLVNYVFFQTSTIISCGLLDRLFEPYAVRDIESGAITLLEAQELIDCLFLRINDRAQIDPDTFTYDASDADAAQRNRDGHLLRGQDSMGRMHGRRRGTIYADRVDSINHWGQNLLISGLDERREDVTGVVSYLFLNAFDKLRLSSPVFSVRLHKNSPDALIRRVSESLKTGGGMPYINNDDVIIPAFERIGIPIEDANRYANSNCWEILLQGCSNQEMIRGINYLLLLEFVLTRGELMFSEGTGGVKTDDPCAFTDFTQLMDAWKIQLDHLLTMSMTETAHEISTIGTHSEGSIYPLISSLMADCVSRAKDISHGGARYILWHVESEAVSNAADAMMMIKRLVFDQKLFTMREIIAALRSNFTSPESPRIMRYISNSREKFANDIDEVDDIAVKMVSLFNQKVDELAAAYRPAIHFIPSVATFSWIQSIGREIGASMDGRFAGETIAANMSPAIGADLTGPTAALNSYLKLDLSAMAAGAPMDLRINGAGLDGQDGTMRLSALIKTFVARKGNMTTFTITSADELRAAIREPQKHRSLRVRMGGWSVYFILLSEETKRLHLKRAEHMLS